MLKASVEKIKLFFGIYNLRNECAKRAVMEMGEEAKEDFLRLYDDINSGTPVSFIEASAVIHIVEETKVEIRNKTFFGKIKNFLKR